jgi:hypothetical protein
MHYVSGLDLGQQADFSALVVCEVGQHGAEWRHDVRHIHRWPLKTPYPEIVADLNNLFGRGPLLGSTLVLDATGVGRGVADMVLSAKLPADVRAYTITAGFRPGDGTVPKVDLVGAVVAALQTGRLRFAESLELTPVLQRELETFRVKVTPDRNETYSAWRERDHDDLVLALALAVWFGERYPPADMTPFSGRDPWEEAEYLR